MAHAIFTHTSGAFAVTCTSTQNVFIDNLQRNQMEWMLCEWHTNIPLHR